MTFEQTNRTYHLLGRTEGHTSCIRDIEILDFKYLHDSLINEMLRDYPGIVKPFLGSIRSLIDESSMLDDDGPEYIEDVPARIVIDISKLKLISIFPFFDVTTQNRVRTKNWNLYANQTLSRINQILK